MIPLCLVLLPISIYWFQPRHDFRTYSIAHSSQKTVSIASIDQKVLDVVWVWRFKKWFSLFAVQIFNVLRRDIRFFIGLLQSFILKLIFQDRFLFSFALTCVWIITCFTAVFYLALYRGFNSVVIATMKSLILWLTA